MATAAVLVLSACTGGGADPNAGATPVPSASAPLVATRDPVPSMPPTLGTFAFVADLKSAEEIPPINDAEASCSGQGRFVLRAKLDLTGRMTAATAQFSFLVKDCPDSTKITLAQIHQAAAGQSGAVMVDSGLTANESLAMGVGGVGFNVEGIDVPDLALATDMIANPGRYYFDLHSAVHSNGVVRGQLTHEP